MSRRTGCPGAGCKPAEVYLAPDDVRLRDGQAVCPRCGGIYRLRADGRLRMHRVDVADIVPMIRRPLDPRRRA